MKNPNKTLKKAMIIFNITGAIVALGWGAFVLVSNHEDSKKKSVQARKHPQKMHRKKIKNKLNK